MDLEMRKRGTGVAIPGLNSSNVRDLPVPHLGIEMVDEMSHVLTPLLNLMLRLGTVSMKLTNVRDTLLPELLSSRLRVPDEDGVVA
jgi:type I restriction enzyme S subunit